MLILGEVHTGLLQNSTAFPAGRCERILALARGRAVRRFERPVDHTASPDLLTGVDCRLATSSGARVRGVGTAAHRATITGGHLLQTSATVHLTGGQSTRRLPWSHYLARPGMVETIGRPDWDDLARGHLAARPSAPTLDLGGIAGRMMDQLQASTLVDRAPPVRAPRTKLRWVAVTAGEAGTADQVRFGVEDDQLRTLRLPRADRPVAAIAGFCEDLALHDWLLSTVLQLLERSRIGSGPPARAVQVLRPAIHHLLHLWMPAARVEEELVELWERLERRPGLSRQWQAAVNRIRDQVAVSAVTLLDADAGIRP